MLSYKNILLPILFFFLCVPVYGIYTGQVTTSPVEIDTLIVKVKESHSISEFKNNSIIKQSHLFSKKSTIPQAQNYYLLTTNKKLPLKSIIKNYQNNKAVEWIVPDTYIYPQNLKNGGFDLITSTPHRTEVLVPTKVPTNIPTRIPSIIATVTPAPTRTNFLGIAVLDSGILPLAVNPSTVVSHSSSPIIDDLGHGTYITQIIQNRVPSSAQIIPFKVIGKEGYGKLSDVLRALQYIHDHPELNIKLVNMSFASERMVLGTDICKSYEIFNPNKSHILYVSAAGNDDQSITPDEDYPGIAPASCNGFIAVGSIKKDNTKTPDSNYGKTVFASLDTVTLPKLTIDKSACKTTFCDLQGTSIATALFTSQLADTLVNNPKLNHSELISSFAKLPLPSKSALAKKSIPIITLPPLKPTTQIKNIGGTEIITKQTTVEKVVKETTTQVIVITPTSRPATSFLTATPQPTNPPTQLPTQSPIKTPTAVPTATPKPVPTATPLPQPTPTFQPIPSEIPVCRDECIDFRDTCPAGTVDGGICPANSSYKLCSCTR